MNTVETPEEKAKRILELKAQTQKRLSKQKEDMEYDEKEKLRRLKERQRMILWMYFKIFLDEEKLRRENEALLNKMKGNFYRQFTEQMQTINQSTLTALKNHDASVINFLFGGESVEETQKRNELLKKANMNDEEFSALAIADLSKTPENNDDLEKVFTGNAPSEKLAAQRKDCLKHAEEAVTDFTNGKVEKMESILKDGLVNACREFSHTKDTVKAIHWSKQINGILSIVNSHPVLFKDGVNSPLLETATGMAAIGRVMENGLESLNELHDSQLHGIPLTPEKEMNLQAQILLMEQSDAQRANEQYQKFFAKDYHPKNGFQEEKLKTLLKHLNTSEAMYTLFAMNREEKLFTLSDMESRKSLSEDLFTPHVEKKAEAETQKTTAPERQLEPPTLHN